MRPVPLLAGLLVALAAASLFTGVSSLTPRAVFTDPEAARLMLVSRVPRTLAALLAGCALAVSGQIMQMLARNRGLTRLDAAQAALDDQQRRGQVLRKLARLPGRVHDLANAAGGQASFLH